MNGQGCGERERKATNGQQPREKHEKKKLDGDPCEVPMEHWAGHVRALCVKSNGNERLTGLGACASTRGFLHRWLQMGREGWGSEGHLRILLLYFPAPRAEERQMPRQQSRKGACSSQNAVKGAAHRVYFSKARRNRNPANDNTMVL